MLLLIVMRFMYSLQYLGLQNTQQITSTLAVLTLQDYYSGKTTWSSEVTDAMQKRYIEYGFYAGQISLNSDSAYWALALYYAYRTYGRQESLLNITKYAYNLAYANSYINASAAINGTGVGRSVSFAHPSSCPFSKILRPPTFAQSDMTTRIVCRRRLPGKDGES